MTHKEMYNQFISGLFKVLDESVLELNTRTDEIVSVRVVDDWCFWYKRDGREFYHYISFYLDCEQHLLGFIQTRVDDYFNKNCITSRKKWIGAKHRFYCRHVNVCRYRGTELLGKITSNENKNEYEYRIAHKLDPGQSVYVDYKRNLLVNGWKAIYTLFKIKERI